MRVQKKYKGIWFYGLSGSGKSYISKILNKKMKDSILVDGDNVRKLISFDLGYDIKSREVQIKRIYGICNLIISSKKFPIASSVYFNKKINNLCKKSGIIAIKVERKNFDKIINKHKTYKNNKDVVGKDIVYEKFKTEQIINNNSKYFVKKINLFNSLNIKW